MVVVENGAAGSAAAALATLLDERPPPPVRIVRPGRNLGFGAGVNRGLAALAGEAPPPEWVLVSNPDLVVHPGALLDPALGVLESHPAWAMVGPRIFTETGEVYPSVRSFPSFTDAAGHALLALFNPENPFTRRYNPGHPRGRRRGRGRMGLGLVLPGPAQRARGAGRLRRGVLHVRRGHGPVLARPRRRVGRGLRRHGRGHPRPGREHRPPPLPHDGGPPPLGPALHVPHDEGLAAGRPAAGRRSCSGRAWRWPPPGSPSAARPWADTEAG